MSICCSKSASDTGGWGCHISLSCAGVASLGAGAAEAAGVRVSANEVTPTQLKVISQGHGSQGPRGLNGLGCMQGKGA